MRKSFQYMTKDDQVLAIRHLIEYYDLTKGMILPYFKLMNSDYGRHMIEYINQTPGPQFTADMYNEACEASFELEEAV